MRSKVLLLCALLAGCGPQPTAVLVHIDAQSLKITHLTLEVTVASQPAKTVDLTSPKLPGEAKVLLPDVAQEVTVAARAVDDQQRNWTTSATVTSKPHAEIDLNLKLGPAGSAIDAGVADDGMPSGEDMAHDDMAHGAPTPTLSLLAGKLGGGSDSFDGQGANARFASPVGIVRYMGDSYVAENQAPYALRRVKADGTVTSIKLVDGVSGNPTGLYYAMGMASDGKGNVFVANWGGCRVDKIRLSDGAMWTIVGNGPGLGDGTCDFADNADGRQARIKNPVGIAVDGNGNLWLADTGNHALRLITLTSDTTASVSTPAGVPGTDNTYVDGAGNVGATQGPARVPNPQGLWIENGLVYFTDGGAFRVLDPAHQNTVKTITPAGDNGGLRGIVPDGAGGYVVADTFGVLHQIHLGMPPKNDIVAGDRNDSDAVDAAGTAARFSDLDFMVGDGDGNIWMTDGSAVRKVRIADWSVTTVAGTSTHSMPRDGTDARLDTTTGIAFEAPDKIYFSDYWRSTIRVYNMTDHSVATLATSDKGLNAVAGMLLDGKGRLWFANQGNSTIGYMSTADHSITFVAGSGKGGPVPDLQSPTAFAFDGDHTLWFGDAQNHVIRSLDTETHQLGVLAGDGTSGQNDAAFDKANFGLPSGLAYDKTHQLLYVGDRDGNTIRALDLKAKSVRRVAGVPGNPGYVDGSTVQARFGDLQGLALDEAAQILYVADYSSHAVRTIDLAHNMVATYVGDGKPLAQPGPLPARIHGPWGLALTPAGLVISENQENGLLLAH